MGFTQPEAILDRYAFQLSGGMAQRVTIALALCSQAKLFIADEPTNGLDQDSKQQTLSLLNDLFPDAAKLVITHDISVAATCGRILVLRGGENAGDWQLRTGVAAPRHPYTQALLGALVESRDAGNAGFAAGDGHLSLLSPLSRSLRTMPRRNTPEDAGRQRMVVLQGMISMEQIDKAFDGKQVLQNVTLDIPDGQICGIFGKRGIGKISRGQSPLRHLPAGRRADSAATANVLFRRIRPMTENWAFRFRWFISSPMRRWIPRQKIGSGFRESTDPLSRLCSQGEGACADGRRACESRIGAADSGRSAAIRSPVGKPSGWPSPGALLVSVPKPPILDEATSMLDVSTQATVPGMVRRQMQEHHGKHPAHQPR